MADTMFWLAACGTALTGVTFAITMFAFFRAGAGSLILRAVMVASLVTGQALLVVPIAVRESISLHEAIVVLALLCATHGVFWWAVIAHGRGRPSGAFATAAPSELVTSGPYRYVRHPFYLAYLLGFCAASALAGEWFAWCVPVWMAGVYLAAARHEERVILSSPLAEQYRHYARRVGGFLPLAWAK